MGTTHVTAQGRRVIPPVVLLDAASSGTSDVLNTHGLCYEVGLHVTFSPGVTAGEVAIEAGPEEDYSGDWATLATLPAVSGGTYLVQRPGWGLCYRVRITIPIADGTVTVAAGGLT